MALPMGTIMAGCMLLGVVFAAKLPIFSRLPDFILKAIGALVLLYSLQHFTEFWGVAAFVSGILMIVTGLYLTIESLLPAWLIRLKPIVLVVLLGYGLMYAVTIYRL